MSEKTKNFLGVATIVALLSFAFGIMQVSGAYSKSAEPASFRSFSATGEGKIVIVPDVAQFTFSVLTQGGKNLGDLQKQNTEKVNKAIAFVKDKGVASKDITTSDYSVEPRYQYSNCSGDAARVCPPPEIVGYSIRQSVLIKARDFSKVGDMLSGVVENGANEVSELNFTIDDPNQVQSEAREVAIARAKEKAKQIAKAGGFSVGRLLSIDEGGYSPMPFQNFKINATMADGRGGAEMSAPSIEPGSKDVYVSVILRYEIK